MGSLGYVLGGLFLAGFIYIARLFRHWEREGHFDKKGHGRSDHPEPGVHYRPLEVPPKPPFD